MKRPEPIHQVKERRDAALQALLARIPYIQFLGITVDRHGDELTTTLSYNDHLIGNPMLPALHGGATAAFLEVTAVIELTWMHRWAEIEASHPTEAPLDPALLKMPKTIDFTVDYLRSGLPRDAYARARVVRSGRRLASVQVEAWQDNKTRLYAHASGHFMMPQTPVPEGTD